VGAGVDTGSRGTMRTMARRIAAAMAAGLLAGLIIGGVGGRIAMLVLRLTSDARLHGLETDDGFTIGIVSSATAFLLILTAVGGLLGGLVYLLARAWLPERLRPWLFGSLTGLVGGALVIRPGGIDFTLLDPLGLAIAMFVALPAAYGVATGFLAERFLRDDSAIARSRLSLLVFIFLIPIALTGVIGLAIVSAIAVAILLARSRPSVSGVLSSAPVIWLGRAALAGVGLVASASLARDVTAVL
jgi:hypothetical protein